MALPRHRSPEHAAHPGFNGLGEKDREKLLENSHLHSLVSGEAFLKIFSPRCYFLILEGELSVGLLRDVPESAALIPAGCWIGECQTSADWIGRLSFLSVDRIKLTLTASGKTSILCIPEQQIKGLSLPGQVRLIKNLDDLSQRFLEELVMLGAQQHVRAERLHAYMAKQVQKRNDDYRKSEIIQSILNNYPKLPLFAARLTTMLQSDHTSAGDIVEAAKLDPSLAGLILRVANSSYYNLPQKVTDFQHAVLLLGFNQIYHLLMDAGIQSVMPKTPEFHKLRFDSVMLSFIAFELALSTGCGKPVTASTIALLQCIGRSVLLLMKKQHPAAAILIDGLDHGKLGALLLHGWNLPEVVCSTIEHQTEPEYSPPNDLPDACRIQVALLYLSQLCYHHLEGIGEESMPTIFLAEYLQVVGVKPMPVEELVRTCIKPGLLKKTATFPDNIRQFLASVEPRWR